MQLNEFISLTQKHNWNKLNANIKFRERSYLAQQQNTGLYLRISQVTKNKKYFAVSHKNNNLPSSGIFSICAMRKKKSKCILLMYKQKPNLTVHSETNYL